ncbi:hypothetical protein [Streptomyces wuyuanensis]|uniref:Uncharacterized protein n=1 Tax=Streptomyces wuyuanensis TaxID=1196353 RepID=A0A1G9VXM6_9ACTN|nr:hypothetical protein [Streptomyces wuyuanensis]SDM77029.1 hypothetical protein SAMN05444921_11341 [Streptomyces wuyuanensis]
MSADQAAEQPAGEEQGSRLAGGCVAVVLVGVPLFALVRIAPESAYVLIGCAGTVGVQRARAWNARRREPAAEGEQPEPVDILATLHEAATDGESVLLTQLQKAADLPDTKAVRGLLKAAGVRVRAGVRTPAGNGPGVHHKDIPPLPLSDSGAPSERCLCRSGANANTNNESGQGPREGLRVEPIGQAGARIIDPNEARRRHEVRAR